MPLSPKTRLGPYEIIAAVGAGGMGEVYRAKDTRLDRIVALKILPEHLSNKPHPRERFEREARTISSLSHPHICALYDIGQQHGIDYLVMEYLEGEILADRLNKGRLALDQALRYAIEIADALDSAHRRSVVHRDIKPGNIMLTKSGAKVLDFGLAKVQIVGTGDGVTAMPTQTSPLTGEGTILGTLPYMAPEQLEGKEADARTDIFALGTLVYEMVTGRRAFEGKSQASLIAAILECDSPSVASVAPAALDRTLGLCLAKDPDDRWQSARDLKAELEWIAESGTEATAAGGRLVLLARDLDGTPRLAMRLLNQSQTTLPAGTENAEDPFFSPNGQWLGFFADGKLKKISVQGGAPVVLGDGFGNDRGASCAA
jgi:eukaryotic-like serine/threonine-protein kinase